MMNLYNIRNSNMYSQTGVWEQGRSPVGRVALIPTSVYITNKFYRSIKTLCADVFCRYEGNPTYGYLSLSARFYLLYFLMETIQYHQM